MRIENVCGHSFVRDFLGPAPVVLDCGVNHGEFSKWIATNLNAKIYGFEPDPRLFPELPLLRNAEFAQAAVTGDGQDIVLNLGEARCSTGFFLEKAGQEAVRVKSIRLDDFAASRNISYVDLLKLDVEGAEIAILLLASEAFLAKVGQITVEFHDFLDKNERPKVQSVKSRLLGLGFECVQFSHFDCADVLFINRGKHPIRRYTKFRLIALKYGRGIGRIIRRTFRPGSLR